MRTKLYTAYINIGKDDPADRMVLVREGFSFWAFLLHVFWLLANRLWLAAAGFMVVLGLIAYMGEVFQLSHASQWALQLLAHLLLGFTAYDLKRAKLVHRGYRFESVVVAENELNAEQRYYEQLA